MNQQATTITPSYSPTEELILATRDKQERGCWHSARELAAQAIRSAAETRPELLPVAQEEASRVHRTLGRHRQAITLLRHAATGYRQSGRLPDYRRCLLLTCEIQLDTEDAKGAQETLNLLGGGTDTLSLRGRLYALTRASFRLASVASRLLQLKRDGADLGANALLILALNDLQQGRTQLAGARLGMAMNVAASDWDVWAMERIGRVQRELHRGGESA